MKTTITHETNAEQTVCTLTISYPLHVTLDELEEAIKAAVILAGFHPRDKQ